MDPLFLRNFLSETNHTFLFKGHFNAERSTTKSGAYVFVIWASRLSDKLHSQMDISGSIDLRTELEE